MYARKQSVFMTTLFMPMPLVIDLAGNLQKRLRPSIQVLAGIVSLVTSWKHQ